VKQKVYTSAHQNAAQSVGYLKTLLTQRVTSLIRRQSSDLRAAVTGHLPPTLSAPWTTLPYICIPVLVKCPTSYIHRPKAPFIGVINIAPEEKIRYELGRDYSARTRQTVFGKSRNFLGHQPETTNEKLFFVCIYYRKMEFIPDEEQCDIK